VVELTGIPKNSVSRAVSRLKKMGLIRRAADRDDGRRAMLSLTAKGSALYERVLPRFQQRQEAMVSVLTAAERQELHRLLNKLVERDDDWAQSG
jgi:DNA-binding MarR family transcriptional regulator